MESQTIVRLVLIILAALVLFAIIGYYNRNKSRLEAENFYQKKNGGRSDAEEEEEEESMPPPGAYAAARARAADDRADEMPPGHMGFESPPRPVMGNDPTPRMRPMQPPRRNDGGDGGGDESNAATSAGVEGFVAGPELSGGASVNHSGVMPMDPMGTEQFRPVDYRADTDGSTRKNKRKVNDCYPADPTYKVEQLLPRDAANSKWSQVNPAGQGDVKDQQFLTSGYHIGINTQSTSLRNATHDIRGDPAPNPRVNVSPWNQSTIGPDLNMRQLDGFK